MQESKLCDYGKEVKKKLVDIDKKQVWLIQQVKKETGLYFDDSYLGKILNGKVNNLKIKAAIEKILGVPANM